jgi:hypothetical protein
LLEPAYILLYFLLHLLSSNHKSTHPCCNVAQKPEMRFLLEACVAPGRLPVGLACSAAARRECKYSLLCKDNVCVIKFIYLRYWFFVFTFWPYVWQLDPGHTYDEHLVLALKPSVTLRHWALQTCTLLPQFGNCCYFWDYVIAYEYFLAKADFIYMLYPKCLWLFCFRPTVIRNILMCFLQLNVVLRISHKVYYWAHSNYRDFFPQMGHNSIILEI